jgi:hypothetical protein
LQSSKASVDAIIWAAIIGGKTATETKKRYNLRLETKHFGLKDDRFGSVIKHAVTELRAHVRFGSLLSINDFRGASEQH